MSTQTTFEFPTAVDAPVPPTGPIGPHASALLAAQGRASIESPRPVATLRATRLRYAVILLLYRAGRPLTLPQLAAHLAQLGLVPVGAQPTKTISDTLRCELRYGRVRRVARGTYTIGEVSRQTRWKMRQRLADLRITW